MKKLATTLCLVAVATGAFAQGVVSIANTLTTAFQTNAAATGGTSGNTSASSVGRYYYEVLTAPSTVTSVDASLQNLLTAPWVDTGVLCSNTSPTRGLMTANGGGSVSVLNWPAGQTNSFIIVGWSASEGSSWSQVAAALSGAQLSGGEWTGGNLASGGFLGATVVGFRQAGGPVGSSTVPTPGLFGTADGQGNPISTTTTLWVVAGTVPEPSSFALAGLGAAAMLIFRRRK